MLERDYLGDLYTGKKFSWISINWKEVLLDIPRLERDSVGDPNTGKRLSFKSLYWKNIILEYFLI